MNLNDCTIYVFVREDLPLGQDDIQSNHAAFHAGMEFAAIHGRHDGIPYMVTVSCPTVKSLNKAMRKMQAAGIGHYVMIDTDVAEDATAIATFPLDKVQKQILSEYRLRKYYPVSAQAVNVGNDGGVANAPIAQLREHSVSNRGVEGENPSGRSISQCQSSY